MVLLFPSSTLFVAGLPQGCTTEQLIDVFGRCGYVLKARIMPSFRQHELAAIIQQQIVIHREMSEARALEMSGSLPGPRKAVSSDRLSERDETPEARRRNVRVHEEEERALLLRFGSHL